MRVEIAKDACVGDEAIGPLLNLIRCFVDGRHEWAPTPDALQALEKYFGELLPAFKATVRNLGEKSAVNLAWSSGKPPSAVRVEPNNLIDVTDDLCRQAVLVVEDIQNDTCFVRAIARVFGATRVLNALERKWLEVRHSGGTGRMAMIAIHARQDFRSIVRVAVLADSDRLAPGQEVPHHARMADLTRQGISVHLLAMREAENYVPNRVLSMSGAPASVARILSRLKTLRPEQRAHYDVKHGFGHPQKPPRIPEIQRELFVDLPRDVKLDLRGGFGDKLLPLLDEQAARLTVADFAALGPEVVTELRALLSVVESVI